MTLVLFALFFGFTVLVGSSPAEMLVWSTVFIELAFLLSFYFIYAGKIVKSEKSNGFSLKSAVLCLFRGKGKAYLLVTLFLALINEIALLESAPDSNLVSMALAMILPLVGSIKTAVLRSVLNYLILVIGSLAAVIIKAFFQSRAEKKA